MISYSSPSSHWQKSLTRATKVKTVESMNKAFCRQFRLFARRFPSANLFLYLLLDLYQVQYIRRFYGDGSAPLTDEVSNIKGFCYHSRSCVSKKKRKLFLNSTRCSSGDSSSCRNSVGQYMQSGLTKKVIILIHRLDSCNEQ